MSINSPRFAIKTFLPFAMAGTLLFSANASCQTWVSDSQYTNQPSLATINASSAYLKGLSGYGIKVGIVDSGINPNNLAFTGAIVAGYNASTGLSGVNNLADLNPGTNNYHGTFTSSEIASRRGIGGYFQGVAYNSSLVVGAVPFGSATDVQQANAINYVSSQGVKVINNSWGYPSSVTYAQIAVSAPQTVSALVNAVANGAVVVFSAGNDATANPSALAMMPSYNSAVAGSWIAVASSTVNGLYMASYSDFCGAAKLYCITAPGGLTSYDGGLVGINGASNSNNISGVTHMQGTSMAAPLVSGTVALVAEAFPWMTSSQLTASVLTTGSLASNPNTTSGRGLLNVGAAVQGPGIFESTFTANTAGYSSTFGNNILGTYGLIKSGLGTLSLTGANTYSGATIINAGAVSVGVGGTTGTLGSGNVVDNSSLIFNRSNSLTTANVISGTGDVTQAGTGTLSLTGANTYSGATIINAGAISVGADSNLGNSAGNLNLNGGNLNTTANFSMIRNVSVSSDSSIQTDASTVLTTTGSFSGGGALTKTGAGDLIVNGVSTNTGDVTVSVGTLKVGSTSANSGATLGGNFTISAGSLLGGYGTIGGAGKTAINNGSISPGGSIGTLSITGNFIQGAGGNYLADVSPSTSDLLKVSGTASLNGAITVTGISGAYTPTRYTFLTSAGRTGGFATFTANLAAYTSLGYFLNYDSNNVYLTLGPDYINTLTSIQANANLLGALFASQKSIQFSGLNYDCNIFGENDVCISAGGRTTNVTNSTQNPNSVGGLLIGAYRFNSQVRAGGWLDQNISNQYGNVKLANNNPMFGLFSTFAPSGNGAGLQITTSASYVSNGLTITRQQLANTEPGSGGTNFNSAAAQIDLGYGFDNLVDNILFTPYIGSRYYNSKTQAYTEQTTSSVQVPVSYQGYQQIATTLLAGLKSEGRFSEQYSAMGIVGVESDLSRNNPTYNGSSQIYGLSSFAVQPAWTSRNTRPFATVGLFYDFDKFQRLGLTSYYREDYYRPINSFTTLLTYTAGI